MLCSTTAHDLVGVVGTTATAAEGAMAASATTGAKPRVAATAPLTTAAMQAHAVTTATLPVQRILGKNEDQKLEAATIVSSVVTGRGRSAIFANPHSPATARNGVLGENQEVEGRSHLAPKKWSRAQISVQMERGHLLHEMTTVKGGRQTMKQDLVMLGP